MTTITEAEKGWLAGIADGEGSFYLSLTKYRDGNPAVKASFAVGNTNEWIILELKRLFTILTGRERRYIPIKGKGNNKRSWLIQLTSQDDLRIFCEVVMPYLKGKFEQARLMLEFVALGRSCGNGYTGLNEQLLAKRTELVAKMKHLNRYRTGSIENAETELASLSPRDLKPSSHWDEVKVRPTLRGVEEAEMTSRQVLLVT